MVHLLQGTVRIRINISGERTMRKIFNGVVNLHGLQDKLSKACTNHLDPTSCFIPQNLIADIKTAMFLLNAAYDTWQVQACLVPPHSDPHGYWKDCRSNFALCNTSQIQFLQDFRNQMVQHIRAFSLSNQNGLFINSYFTHCQSEIHDTWFASNGPQVNNKKKCDPKLAPPSDAEVFLKTRKREPGRKYRTNTDTNIKKMLNSGQAVEADDMVTRDKEHGRNSLVGRGCKSFGTAPSSAPSDQYMQELTTKIKCDLESELEAKVNRKFQENITWVLKRLGDANPDLKLDIGVFCPAVSSEDDNGTPMT